MEIVITYFDNGEHKAHIEGVKGAACESLIDLDDLLGGETIEEGHTPDFEQEVRRVVKSTQKQRITK